MKHPNPRSQLFFKAINKLGWEREQVVWEEKNNNSEFGKFLPNCRLSQKLCLSVKFCKYKWEFIIIPLPPQKIPRYCWKTTESAKHCVLLVGILHFACSFRCGAKKKTKKPYKNTSSFQNSMLLNNERLNGKGKNDEILKRILWTYFLVSGADWKYDTFSMFFCFFWMQNLIRSNGKPPVLFFALKNEEVLPSSDKPAANTASMLQLLTSSLLFPN